LRQDLAEKDMRTWTWGRPWILSGTEGGGGIL